MEPIQAEGGDHHFRPAFLQAMQAMCREFDALFVVDEVQTGCGLTGTAWAYQQLGVQPDVVAFGKKTQVCGVMAGGRVDEVPDNVFAVSSRINSTWGGSLVDMVRARKILEVIESEDLIAHAASAGASLVTMLRELEARQPLVTHARGRGLLCAFSLPDKQTRDAVLGDAARPRGRPAAAVRDAQHPVPSGAERDPRRSRGRGRRRRAGPGDSDPLPHHLDGAARMIDSLIGGTAVRGTAGTFVSTNPAQLSETVAEVSLASAEQLVEACRVASAAQLAWAQTPAPVRGRVIAQIGRLVEANAEALADLIVREVGKPRAEALGEVQEIVDTCDFFLGEGRRLYGQTVPSEMRDKQLFTFRVPVGVAMIITAGNFPVAVPSWYLVPALLCGNAVVWKPADYAAALGDALTQIFLAGGVPAGVLNTVHADGPTTFEGLTLALEEGVVQKVGFTGSSEVGAQIGALCGRFLQSPCLELGGKNPLVVMPDADSTSPPRARCSAASARRVSAAPRSAWRSSTRTSTTPSSPGSSLCVERP